MLGAFAVGPLADRHGRKTMLVVSMIVFGAASLASSYSGGSDVADQRSAS